MAYTNTTDMTYVPLLGMESRTLAPVNSESNFPDRLYILFLLACCSIGILSRLSSLDTSKFPLGGHFPRWLPRSFHGWHFAYNAASVLQQGYSKFKHVSFELLRFDGNIVVLPASLIEEISALPSVVASPNGALEHDLLGELTGLNLILESRLHHSIVQRKLTPRLPALIPGLQEELRLAIDEYVPSCDEWTRIQPYQVLARISARLTGRVLVGPTMCKDPRWLDLSINYTENLFRTVVVTRLFVPWLQPFVCRLLPSYWQGRRYIAKAKALLGPIFEDLLTKNDNGDWTPGETPDEFNVLSWLADGAKGKDRDAGKLAHVQVLLALAAIHTTLLRMVNVVYDVTNNPEYFQILREEVFAAGNEYNRMHKLDSVLKESQRMSPPTILGLKRLFLQPYTFANGLHIPQGTYTCLPTFAIENDPENNSRPDLFDGLRSYHKRQKLDTIRKSREGQHNANDFQLFSSFDKVALNFGYGKSACPGRFFASLTIKMVVAQLLVDYDFKFLPGKERPRNIIAHEFLFTWPWQEILVKHRRPLVNTEYFHAPRN